MKGSAISIPFVYLLWAKIDAVCARKSLCRLLLSNRMQQLKIFRKYTKIMTLLSKFELYIDKEQLGKWKITSRLQWLVFSQPIPWFLESTGLCLVTSRAKKKMSKTSCNLSITSWWPSKQFCTKFVKVLSWSTTKRSTQVTPESTKNPGPQSLFNKFS